MNKLALLFLVWGLLGLVNDGDEKTEYPPLSEADRRWLSLCMAGLLFLSLDVLWDLWLWVSAWLSS